MDTPWARPATPHALHDWIATVLDLRICRTPLILGHQAPFDYLLHTHFEGQRFDELPFTSNNTPNTPTPLPPAPHNNAHDPTDPRAPVIRPHSATLPLGHPAASSSLRLSVASPASPHPPDLLLWANRGGGKTFLGALATTLDLLFKPGIEVRILAGSLEQSKRMFAHLRRFFSIPDLTSTLEGRITERRIVLRNHSTVEILAQSEASVRGTRVQKLRCDEVDLFDPAIWEAAQLTTRSTDCNAIHVRGAVECLSTMHRPNGLMFRLVKDASNGSRRLFKWGVVDTLALCGPEHQCPTCPLQPECAGRAKRFSGGTGLQPVPEQPGPLKPAVPTDDHPHRLQAGATADPGHIPISDAITLKSRVSQSAWESEMLCLRPSRGHCVLPEFDPKLHVVFDTPREGQCVAGMDFGFRADTVILWATLETAPGEPPTRTLWITHEHVRAEMLLDDHIAAIKSPRDGRPSPVWIAADSAGHQRHEQTGISNIDAMRKAGLAVHARALTIGEGLALLRARLKPAIGPPRLLIHHRCTRLIEALERYHYPEDNPESMTPVKDGQDHPIDALRYLIAALDKPFKSTITGYVGGT